MGPGRLVGSVLAAALVVVPSACGGGAASRSRAVRTTTTAPTTTAPTTTLPTTTLPTTTASSVDGPSTTVAASRPSTPTTLAPSPTTGVPTSPTAHGPGAGPLAGRTIVVDPGHNGGNSSHTREIARTVDAGGFRKACNTTGTAGGSYAESTFTWATAQRLVADLRQRGADVVLTRNDDTGWGPCIDERGLTAQRAHADLLLSIHADGADAGAHGFHVISPTVTRGFTDASAGPSAVLAASIRDALVASGMTPATYVGRSGLIARGDLGTLNRAGVPAVILESGNMRNAGDLAMLRSPEGQSRIAAAMADGTTRFLTGR